MRDRLEQRPDEQGDRDHHAAGGETGDALSHPVGLEPGAQCHHERCEFGVRVHGPPPSFIPLSEETSAQGPVKELHDRRDSGGEVGRRGSSEHLADPPRLVRRDDAVGQEHLGECQDRCRVLLKAT